MKSNNKRKKTYCFSLYLILFLKSFDLILVLINFNLIPFLINFNLILLRKNFYLYYEFLLFLGGWVGGVVGGIETKAKT